LYFVSQIKKVGKIINSKISNRNNTPIKKFIVSHTPSDDKNLLKFMLF
jgi:hypothetical protein